MSIVVNNGWTPEIQNFCHTHYFFGIQLPNSSREAMTRLVQKCNKSHGMYMHIVFDIPRKPRSTGPGSQNHKLNGGISQFCQETGNDFDDIKIFLKRRAMRRGLPPKLDDKGNIVYSKIDGEPLPMSEADMSTIQCGMVIDEMEQFFAEEGFVMRETK
jgi:hypothetical protein